MKSLIILTNILIVSLLFLSACGINSNNNKSTLDIRGTLIDSPVHGATYRCGDITNTTDTNGVFLCNTFPIIFYAGGVKLGKIDHLSADGYVTPQDLAGVSREEFNDQVAKIAMFLQSLDDDGNIDHTITLDSALIKQLKNKDLVISEIHTTQINELLDQIGAVNIVSKEEALQHLHQHLPKNKPEDKSDTQNDTNENHNDTNDHNNSSQTDTFKQKYLKLINEARAQGRKCGKYGYMPAVSPVTWNDKLYHAALEHSKDMAKSNTFSHTGSGTQTDETAQAKHPGQGSTVKERLAHNNYQWHSYGENIAAGMDQASEAINGWLKSPGHCQNIMDASFKEVGMAVYYNQESDYYYYWTQVFGRP